MYELEPNEDNIKETLITDVLGRNNSLINFFNLIYSINTKCSICIDGDWGTGKTFFVKQAEFVINLLNNVDNGELDSKLEEFLNKTKSVLEEKGISTYGNTSAIYYNATEYDYFDEPILTLIADIIKNNPKIELNNEEVKKKLGEKIDAVLSAFKFGLSFQTQDGNMVGVEVQKQKGDEKKSVIDAVIADKNIESAFKTLLEDLIVEKSNRLVIFIDELDRCNPKFAMKLLERIKYFFKDDRFIFVFSTNLNQLQYTVKKYYGNDFDGCYYLQKFFDYQLELPKIELDNYINYHINLIPLYSSYCIDNVIKEIIIKEKFNLRDCNKYFELLKLRYEELRNSQAGMFLYFFVGMMFTVLLAVKIKNLNEYNLIKNGNGLKAFKKIMKCPEMDSFFKEVTRSTEINDNDIEELYNFMFVDLGENYKVIKEQFKVHRAHVNKMNDMLSYLGENVIL